MRYNYGIFNDDISIAVTDDGLNELIVTAQIFYLKNLIYNRLFSIIIILLWID